MVKERRIKEFQRMHKELMDPEERVKAKREADKQKRFEDKKSDTGIL